MPGLEQPEGLTARSSMLSIQIHAQCVNGLSKSIWRAFFVPGNGKEVIKKNLPPLSYLEDRLEQIIVPKIGLTMIWLAWQEQDVLDRRAWFVSTLYHPYGDN